MSEIKRKIKFARLGIVLLIINCILYPFIFYEPIMYIFGIANISPDKYGCKLYIGIQSFFVLVSYIGFIYLFIEYKNILMKKLEGDCSE